jgi:hypothetical protein
VSYATDDGIGLLYEGTEPVEVIADTSDTSDTLGSSGSSGSFGSSGSADPDGPAAYRVEVAGGVVSETALRPGRLT